MNKTLIISDKNKKSLFIKKKINKILNKQKLNKSNIVIVIVDIILITIKLKHTFKNLFIITYYI